jgi:hypothetical protein
MKEKEASLKERFETINRLLEEEYVVVHVDASQAGVVLPGHLSRSHSVTLKLSKFFRGGIEVTEQSIVTNLLFDNEYFECTLPMQAIWGVTTVKGNNIVWPENAPQEILQKIGDTVPAASVISAAPPAPEKDNKGKKAGHLRRIK